MKMLNICATNIATFDALKADFNEMTVLPFNDNILWKYHEELLNIEDFSKLL